MGKEDTIAAIATGMTDSGIGIVRISGERAVETGDALFCTSSGKHILKKAESHKMYYGYAVNGNSEVMDEVMAVVMRAPKSFTGEDTVEIQCHGGVFLMQKILSEALLAGARLAQPGEFTKRAFLNGKIDLTRAEAVMDIIQSQNDLSLSISAGQLKGDLYHKIRRMRNDIIFETAFIESALDDPEHISLEGYSEKLKEKVFELTDEVSQLLSTADNGKLIKEGIHTVIVGKPNVGKSSLMNLLVGEERAIVTDIAGTTRDILQETVRLGDINFHITDTAGIHETDDQVEQIGVERAKEYAVKADLILYIVDVSLPLDERDREILKVIKDRKVIVFLNKSDLRAVLTEEDVTKFLLENIKGQLPSDEKNIYFINTTSKNRDWLTSFENMVNEMFFQGELRTNRELMITNLRHKEALQEALQSLEYVKKSIENKMPEDFYSIDLMSAYSSLGRMIGEEVDDDLVEEIFSRFCMGK